jgi:hypothetical protein
MQQVYILTQQEHERIEMFTKSIQSRIRQIFDKTHDALDHCDMSIYAECDDLIGRVNDIRNIVGLSEVRL